MKTHAKYIIIAVVVILIVATALLLKNNIGIMERNLEKDARFSHKIDESWQMEQSTSKEMSAMIFYPDSCDDFTYSIYIRHPGLSFGYFFRAGGSGVEIEQGVLELGVGNVNERAFLSMNLQKVSYLEIDDGNTIETIQIDSSKPFAIVLPNNIGSVTLYNIDGNIVESIYSKLA